MSYMAWCFCNNDEPKLFENDLAYVLADGSPVSKGHVLITTKRHTPTWFETTPEERVALHECLDWAKKYLDAQYHPDGYNIGANCGLDAGQSVMHVHIHLIPRYHGDVDNPRGGVRGIIPHKQNPDYDE